MLQLLTKVLPVLVTLSIFGCETGQDIQSIASQVRGNGCSYDTKCEAHWSWWQRQIVRNADYACRMRAAECLAKLGTKAMPVISELQVARSELTERFDTGDGVLEYGKCIDASIAEIKGEERPSVVGTLACGF